MPLLQALTLVASLLRAIQDMSSSATASSGDRLNSFLTAISEVSKQAQAVLGMIQRAGEQQRTELTEEEKSEIMKLDARARDLQMAAIGTESTQPDQPAGDEEGERSSRRRR